MNVWIRKARKKAKCYHCGQDIEAGEYQVVCTYYMKLAHSEKHWKMTMRFHAKEPYCWVDRAVTELELRPPHAENRGRKPLDLNDTMREKRLKIMRRRASIMQRLNAEWDGKRRMGKVMHLTEMLEGVKKEIETYGGVPDSW